MEGFNPQTGEFESVKEEKIQNQEGKKMKTKEGKIVFVMDDKTIFDPEKGEFIFDYSIEDLEEI